MGNYITKEGMPRLHKRMNELIKERPSIIKQVASAREMGDLSENAEYHAAKEDQANINKKIAELEDLITRVVIIDPSTLAHDKISFGSTISLIDVATDEEITYTIVSSAHSNPDEGKISFHSPLAKQLLGKSVGDECIAQLPGGKKEFEIEEVYYDEDRLC